MRGVRQPIMLNIFLCPNRREIVHLGDNMIIRAGFMSRETQQRAMIPLYHSGLPDKSHEISNAFRQDFQTRVLFTNQ